jgi:hypothetical protein
MLLETKELFDFLEEEVEGPWRWMEIRCAKRCDHCMLRPALNFNVLIKVLNGAY